MAMATKLACAALCIAVASGFAPSRPGGAAPAARRDGRAAVAVAAAVESLSLSPIAKVGGVVRLPGSKSLSNRALLIAALCEGETTVENLLASDDTERMLEALAAMGVAVADLGDAAVRVTSSGALKAPGADLFLGNAGTAMRPLAAVLAAVAATDGGDFVLDGTPRMRERPIEDLVDGLKQLGCDVECTQNGDFGGCPPVVVKPGARVDGGVARVSGKTSSQFLSALLLASPLLATTQPLVIEITDELISQPYVQLTVDLMAKFGVVVDIDGAYRSFTVAPAQKYTNAGLPDATYFVEGDASSASYFLAAAAMTGGDLTVVGCGSESTQGDVRSAEVLRDMGAPVTLHPTNITVAAATPNLKGIDVDCLDIPAAMTLAAVALVAAGPTTIRNVGSWRVKETERMKAIVAETTKLGADVFEGDTHCVITPPAGKPNAGAEIETYDDHRIAMTFALAACAGVPVTILDPKCTSKTFPTYYDELARVTLA
ncbi:shikimate 3-dehydrogenase [Aureococcus anophagefferens]|nr:shikimate 3-dehydrogenase [Aureococcus anophagefferens]